MNQILMVIIEQKETKIKMTLIDETGNQHGRLKVISRAENYRNYAQWLCECECGNQVIVLGTSLRNKNTQSCGCLLKESASRNGKLRFDDLTDKTFNKLKCIKRIESISKDPLWLCECECGSLTQVFANNLKRGSTKSCGCLKSFGEEKISMLLKENNIPFIKEYCFPNCKYPDTLAPVRFDFG